MALDRDAILVDNLRGALDLYQRSLVWSMTAAAAFFVLTLSLGDPKFPSVSVLYGQLSGPAAWFVALALFLVLGILATSALSNAEAILTRLSPEPELLEALLLYPSLATNPNGFVRIGSVMFPPIAVLLGFGLELRREWTGEPHDAAWWFGLALFVVLIGAPYAAIATRLWHRLGSRQNREQGTGNSRTQN
jgi:hypothetical protein